MKRINRLSKNKSLTASEDVGGDDINSQKE